MKSFTDLEQSKKLAEILPLESADMEYIFLKEGNVPVGKVPFIKDDSEVENSAFGYTYSRTPCWSLAALLGVLPRETRLLKSATDDTYHCDCLKGNVDKWFNNPVDTCYELILQLHEYKML